MASWSELNEWTCEPSPRKGLRARVDAFVLARVKHDHSLSPFERAGRVRPMTPHARVRTARLAETAVLVMLGPPVLALRFGVAAVHRRKGLST